VFITRRNNPILFQADEGAGTPGTPEETPDPTTATEAEIQQEVDWQKRYSDLQPEYTRASQEAAELRRQTEHYQQLLTSDDPDTRRQAAEALGYQLDEPEPEYDEDLDPRVAKRLEELEQRFQQQSTQAQQQERLAELETLTERELDALKVPADDAVRDWIVSRAVALPPTEQGLPDVRAAYAEFEALINAQKKQWASTKRTHQFSAVGTEGTQTPDLDKRQDRVDWMTQRLLADQQP
jgi:hypothetical protein